MAASARNSSTVGVGSLFVKDLRFLLIPLPSGSTYTMENISRKATKTVHCSG